MSQARARLLAGLTHEEIQRGDSTWCRRWLRMCGIVPPAATRVRELRRQLTPLRDAAGRGERVPVVGATNPLPWRLSKRAKTTVNARVASHVQ